MPRTFRRVELHEHVVAVMKETGQNDPFEAVRIKARDVVSQFHQLFGGSPPFNVNAIASFRGLTLSDDDPRFSPDSEIAPEADGRVVLRVNKSRPVSRQRFSVCHEIGHTLFPEYELAVRCRKPSERTWADSEDLLETLCDVAASELMFPSPWFPDRIAEMPLTADSIAETADDYQASREATVRRLVELYREPLAAVFFSWKLKPTEVRAMKERSRHTSLFPDMEPELPMPKLRVDYAILNAQFEARFTSHIPKDKSISSDGPIHSASILQETQDGKARLDLGTLHGDFEACAIPIFTQDAALGPDGGCSVAAVLRPA